MIHDNLFSFLLIAKGQLISKQNCRAKSSPKKRTKNCKNFCPTSQGRNPCNFSFVFWEKFLLHKFILKLTDLYFCNEIFTIFCRFWPMEIWFCLLFELKTTTKKCMHRPTVAWLLTHLAKFNQEMSTYEQVQQSIFFTHLFLTENLEATFAYLIKITLLPDSIYS